MALSQEIFDRVFRNWKSSLRGLLVAVVVICGVLAAQGVTLGRAGTGSVVGLVAALAIALQGLLSRDKQPT